MSVDGVWILRYWHQQRGGGSQTNLSWQLHIICLKVLEGQCDNFWEEQAMNKQFYLEFICFCFASSMRKWNLFLFFYTFYMYHLLLWKIFSQGSFQIHQQNRLYFFGNRMKILDLHSSFRTVLLNHGDSALIKISLN